MTAAPKNFDPDSTITEYQRLLKLRWGIKPAKERIAIDRGLEDLRAKWQAWSGKDDLHETAMSRWVGDAPPQ